MGKTLKCPAVRLTRQAAKAVSRLNMAHVMNMNAMTCVAGILKGIRPRLILPEADARAFDSAINILNNPEEAEDGD